MRRRHLAVNWYGENGRSNGENIRSSSSNSDYVKNERFLGKLLNKVIMEALANLGMKLGACRHFFNDL